MEDRRCQRVSAGPPPQTWAERWGSPATVSTGPQLAGPGAVTPFCTSPCSPSSPSQLLNIRSNAHCGVLSTPRGKEGKRGDEDTGDAQGGGWEDRAWSVPSPHAYTPRWSGLPWLSGGLWGKNHEKRPAGRSLPHHCPSLQPDTNLPQSRTAPSSPPDSTSGLRSLNARQWI